MLVLFVGNLAAGPGLLLYDNFNSEHGGTGVLNYNNFLNWDVVDGTVDLIGNGYFDFQPGYGLYVDMDGSTGNAGKLISKTTFSLAPRLYELCFDLAGNHRNSAYEQVTVQVAMGTLFNKSYTLTANAPFTTFTEIFQVNSLTDGKLTFEGYGGDNIGMLLDNVKFSVIPEPGTLLLLCSGLLGFGVIAKLRRKKNNL